MNFFKSDSSADQESLMEICRVEIQENDGWKMMEVPKGARNQAFNAVKSQLISQQLIP